MQRYARDQLGGSVSPIGNHTLAADGDEARCQDRRCSQGMHRDARRAMECLQFCRANHYGTGGSRFRPHRRHCGFLAAVKRHVDLYLICASRSRARRRACRTIRYQRNHRSGMRQPHARARHDTISGTSVLQEKPFLDYCLLAFSDCRGKVFRRIRRSLAYKGGIQPPASY